MRSIVLSGFAGTGKSTIGRALAAKLDLPFRDTDAEIEARAGKPVATIFRDEGEGAFRELEREVVLAALGAPPCVIACGGGALVPQMVRFAALDAATVVTLRASIDAIVERTRASARPILNAGDPAARAARVRDLLETRAEAYAEHHASLDTTTSSIDDVVRSLALLRDDTSIVVPLGRRSHLYRCVEGSPEALSNAIAALAPSGTLVVTDANVARLRTQALASLGRCYVALEPGEANKTLDAIATIWDEILGLGLDRDGVVVALGGGVVGDLAGFAAATALRGLRWVQAPTTLLSMVDASIGGKTGFDHASGKNRIGAFHQPSAILADLEHLATLPEREVRAGMAEVVKIAIACDPELFERLEAEAIARVEIVRRAAAAKIRVVRVDELERAGLRAVLNLGHTIGHALEVAGKYRAHLHGEAVAIGLIDELAATTRLGVTPEGVMTRVKRLLEKLGLPTHADDALRAAAIDRVTTDKKRFGDSIELPMVTGVGTSRVERVPLTTFRSALA